MPEMPEVEIIRRDLADKVAGRRIMQAIIDLPRLIKWPAAAEFQAVATGKQIERLGRRGKYLLFYLEDSLVLVVHLRMTGRLYYTRSGELADKYTRIIFSLDNGDQLLYADTRTLGTLYLLPQDELWRISGLSTMGPEPLTTEFTLEYLSTGLANRKAKIKALLLNQQFIGGLGNIYVDECLFVAGIHPERIASSLNPDEASKLYDAINQVIAAGIEDGGTTFRDYRNGRGGKGSHQHNLYVYGRTNQPCHRCGNPIQRIEVAGRGTHFCPHCQH